jgi:hypothetical protein
VALHERLRVVLRRLELRRGARRPTIARFAARNASTTPAASGASGPTIVSATLSFFANATRSGIASIATFTTPGSRAVPAFPGATNTRATRGELASFQAIACSRPPPPMTRTFMVGKDALELVAGRRNTRRRRG